MYSGDIKVEELDVSQWRSILKDFRESGGNGVTFTGGEVLMYKGFSEILEFTEICPFFFHRADNGNTYRLDGRQTITYLVVSCR